MLNGSIVVSAASPVTNPDLTKKGDHKPGDAEARALPEDWPPPPPPAPPAQTSTQVQASGGAVPKRKRETDSGKGGKER